jgi:hypothetical protein
VPSFSFVVNKSFLGSNSHPITVPRTQVRYSELAQSGAGGKPLRVICPNGRRLHGQLYEGEAGFGHYYQIRMEGGPGDPLFELCIGDLLLIDLNLGTTPAEVRIRAQSKGSI